MVLGGKVCHRDDPDTWGTVVARYIGGKPAMNGMVEVDWGDGHRSWEQPADLIPEPKEEN